MIIEENENRKLKNRISEKSKWKISKSKNLKCKISFTAYKDSSFCLRGGKFIALNDPPVVLNDHWKRKWKSKIEKSNIGKVKVENFEVKKVKV